MLSWFVTTTTILVRVHSLHLRGLRVQSSLVLVLLLFLSPQMVRVEGCTLTPSSLDPPPPGTRRRRTFVPIAAAAFVTTRTPRPILIKKLNSRPQGTLSFPPLFKEATTRTTWVGLSGVQKPFGEQQYWEDWYQNRSSSTKTSSSSSVSLSPSIHNNATLSSSSSSLSSSSSSVGDFSWYAQWDDMRPFVHEFLGPGNQNDDDDKYPQVLIPGIGMDWSLVWDMYQCDGYQHVNVFDYAPTSIQYVQNQWKKATQVGLDHVPAGGGGNGDSGSEGSAVPCFYPSGGMLRLNACVADIRSLPYPSESFDLILDKGTLDSVYLCGSTRDEQQDNLALAVSELQRVLKSNGGVFWSLSGICSDALTSRMTTTTTRTTITRRTDNDENGGWLWPESKWESCVDTRNGNLFITSNGYTSNNLDGSLMIWRKK